MKELIKALEKQASEFYKKYQTHEIGGNDENPEQAQNMLENNRAVKRVIGILKDESNEQEPTETTRQRAIERVSERHYITSSDYNDIY